MGHNFARAIELARTLRQFAQRNQVALQITNLVLVRFAHIENEKIVATVETSLQFARRNFGNACSHGNKLLSTDSAELFVIDELMNCRVVAANRARRIPAQPQLAEAHAQRVEEQETPGERFADAENELDRFHRLKRAHDTGENTQDAAFGAGGHEAGRRWLGIEAAVARPTLIVEDGGLPLKTKDRAIDIRLIQKNAS